MGLAREDAVKIDMPTGAKQANTGKTQREQRGTPHATCEADAEGWMEEVG
jgi:hypothetical protein